MVQLLLFPNMYDNINLSIRTSRDVHLLASKVSRYGKEFDFVECALVQAYWKDKESFHVHWNKYMKDKNER